MSPTPPVDVSVVIPSYNRAHLLDLALPALAAQDVGDLRYEVLYVVNGSTDDTEERLEAAVERWPEVFRFEVIEGTGTPAAPRNRGIREARGPLVVILDNDVVPDPRLVRSHVDFHRAHPEPHHAAIGEVYVPDDLRDDPASMFHDLISFEDFRGRERLSFLDFWTCNVSFKRDFMARHGMFDETISYYEDVECGHRLEAAGMHLHFLPEARGEHVHEFRLDNVPAKARTIGRGLWELEQRVTRAQARQIRARHGVMSLDLPAAVLARRLVNRAGFAALANPVSLGLLRAVAARSRTRTRLTDLYWYLLFRGEMRAGYREAKRASFSSVTLPAASWS